ncbi:MAG: glycosyltransferase family 4 protein [Gemmataceae bacterium]
MGERVLLVNEVFPPRAGGSGRWFYELYRRLPAEAVAFAVGEAPGHETVDASLATPPFRLPFRFVDRGLRRDLFGYLRTVKRLQPIIRSQQVTCIHAGRCLPEGLIAFLLGWWNRLPFLCYVHGEDLSVVSTSRELTLMVRPILKRAEYLIANSRNTRDMIVDKWSVNANKVRVLYPGVDTKAFVPASRDVQVRQSLGWGSGPVLLTVGRLQKRKGQDQLIRAVARLRTQFPDLRCAIVGDGEEREPLKAIARELHLEAQVLFMGEIDDATLQRCYQQCDLFVLANRTIGADFEGFGMVLLEAQACGKPVVAGESGGTAETMRIPETGLVLPCEEPDLLAEKLAELLKDPDRLAGMGAAGRQWTVDHFDWDVLSQQARQLFFEKTERGGKE